MILFMKNLISFMINNKIIKIQPLDKWISFIIHINNICNFKCSYCTAGHQISKDKLTKKDILNIINSINELRNKWDTRKIDIDLTWWEPTLHNDLVKFIKLFLYVHDLNIQVTTNLLRIPFFENELRELSLHKNITNFSFNISYHYFEYRWKENNFINSINIIKKYWFNFKIKFLLPDNYEKLENFEKTKNMLFLYCNINEQYCEYDLIIDTMGKVSWTYWEDMLDYFYNKWYLSENNIEKDKYNIIKENISCNIQKCEIKKWLNIYYENWEKENLDFFEIRTRWLNRFKWFNCYYISDSYMEIHVSHKWYVTFGPCYILDNMRYDINK